MRKKVLNTQSEVRRVRYHTFAVCESGGVGGSAGAGVLTALHSVNCEVGDKLRAGLGLTALTRADGSSYGINASFPTPERFFDLPAVVDGGYERRVGFVTGNGTVYLDDGGKPLSRHAFGAQVGTACAFDESGAPRMAFASEKGIYFYSEETGMVATGIDAASRAVCYYKDRAFGVAPPCTLVYSAPLGVTDFAESIDDGGRLELPRENGGVVALAVLDGALYAFYERGISRISAAGSAREFVVQELGYGGGRIFGDSVGVCSVGGEKAFFLAEDGLYRFDGEKVCRICENLALEPKTSDQICGHAVAQGRYFLRFLDKNGEEQGVIVDASSSAGYRSFAATALSSFDGKAVCYEEGGVQYYDPSGAIPWLGVRSFTAEGLDFDTAGQKTLRRLRIFGAGEAVAHVCGGGRTRTVKLDLSDGFASVYVGVRGERFSLVLELGAGAEISVLEAEIERLKRAARGGDAV